MDIQKDTTVNLVKNENPQVHWMIITYKLLFGLFEFFLGISITLFSKIALEFYRTYTIQELSEDPHDLLVRLTENLIPNVLTHHTFLAIYLVVLGSAKIAGAIGLIYNKYWGVDLLVGLTLLMLPFQIIRISIHPSIFELVYTLLGVTIALYLIDFKPIAWVKHLFSKF